MKSPVKAGLFSARAYMLSVNLLNFNVRWSSSFLIILSFVVGAIAQQHRYGGSMKTVIFPLGVACLVVSSCMTTIGQPGTDAPLRIFVTTVKQGDSPIQITGLKFPNKVNGNPTVLFHNVSGKDVRWFHITAVIGNPCDSRAHDKGCRQVYGSAPRRKTMLVRPNETGEDTEQFPRSTFLVGVATELRSSLMHVAVVVGHVEFSDGTKWYQNGSDGALWQSSLSAESAKSCQDVSMSADAISRLRGSAFDGAGQAVHTDQQPQQSYSYSCYMRKDESYEFAHCPF
jgi:hypothetical protein